MTTKQRARVGYNQTGQRTDADACSSARKGLQDGGAAGSTRAFLRAALRPLYARDPLFLLVSLLL